MSKYKTTVYLEPAAKDYLDNLRLEKGVSQNFFIEKAIEEKIKREQGEPHSAYEVAMRAKEKEG